MLDRIDLNQKISKKAYKQVKPELYQRLFNVQKASWESGISVIILIEGWRTASRGTILQRLTRPLDPRGFKLHSIRAATTLEKKHPWLWRYWLSLPVRGEWVIFDRSWYRRVSDERVHKMIPEADWRRAYRDIVEFERTLTNDGSLIYKFFLHISKQEQKRRHNKQVKNPHTSRYTTDKTWEQLRYYNEWLSAYREIFERTETEWGPWTIVEATDYKYALVKILGTIITSIENQLGWHYTPLPSIEKPAIHKQGIEEIIDTREELITTIEIEGSEKIEEDNIQEEDTSTTALILEQEEPISADEGEQ